MGTNGIRNMSIKLIIFDFDGTLGDTRRNIVVTMQDVMKELSLPLQDEDVCASTIGLPLKGCYAKMFPQLKKCKGVRRSVLLLHLHEPASRYGIC